MSTEIPLRRFQVRWLRGRDDIRGHEEGKPRPWAVLSGDDLHDFQLLAACSVTTAQDRQFRRYIEESTDSPFKIDTQQIWTYRDDQIQHDRGVDRVPKEQIGRLLEKLTTRLRVPYVESRGAPSPGDIGRIVWIDLLAGPNVTRSDLTPLRTALRSVGVAWPHADTQLPCIVVASDLSERGMDQNHSPFKLITVVPLVSANELLEPELESPTITIPAERQLPPSGTAPLRLAALSQVLLTVDYRKRPDHMLRLPNRRTVTLTKPARVSIESRRVLAWRASAEETETVRADVRLLLGLADS
jgi:mRNA-degrading endonuclease toxin of MazEF toxin-antitoxin module